MRTYPLLGVALAVGIGVAGWVPSALGASPTAQLGVTAAAQPAKSLYVSPCSTSGDGSQARPFCDLSAAAAAAQPGQTVLVAPGVYRQPLNITRSGSPGAPITFKATQQVKNYVQILPTDTSVPAISISGVHDVIVQGFSVNLGRAAGLRVNSSSDLTIDQGDFRSATGLDSIVQILGSSNRVTISRSTIAGKGAGLAAGPGTGSLSILGNVFETGGPAITLRDSPAATITGNTVVSSCSTGIAATGDSPTARLANNIVQTYPRVQPVAQLCPTPLDPVGITISPGSVAGTTSDYNVIDSTRAATLYSWAGTGYTALDAFRAATGQGARDIAADPLLQLDNSPRRLGLAPGSPALDSANVNAAGAMARDFFDNGRANDPAAPNTGTGFGYADRGAIETTGPVAMGGGTLLPVAGGGPLDSVSTATLKPTWEHTGPIGKTQFTFDDSTTAVMTHTTAKHTFARAGVHCRTQYQDLNGFRGAYKSSAKTCQTFGAHYTPVSTTRILDTRSAVGVKTKVALKANATLTVPISTVGGLPASKVSALALNLTAIKPGAAGNLAVRAIGDAAPKVSTLTFNAGRTRSNLAIVPLTTGITIHNRSASTVHLTADLKGYYSNAGSGFAALKPVRVLDTRKGTGAAAKTLKARGVLDLDLTSRMPTTATGAVLAVAVSAPTAGGGVSVYAPGKPRPTPLDLSFAAKASASNLVISQVSKGRVRIYNASSGTVHLTADLSGYFGPSATQAFVPRTYSRILDTGATPMKTHGTANIYPKSLADSCTSGCPTLTAAVYNITVSQAKRSGTAVGYVTTKRPAVSSLSFTAGQPVSNLTTLPEAANLQSRVYNNSTGTIRIVVDQQGYYIAKR